jgi:hypothetical protein
MGEWELPPASMADVEAVAELRAVVLRADLERLGRYDERRVRSRYRYGGVAMVAGAVRRRSHPGSAERIAGQSGATVV